MQRVVLAILIDGVTNSGIRKMVDATNKVAFFIIPS